MLRPAVVMMGQRGIAQDVALQNVEAFAGDHDVILTLCASCASHLKHGYAELFAAQPDRLPEIRAFADKVMDFSTFAPERLGESGGLQTRHRNRDLPCFLPSVPGA